MGKKRIYYLAILVFFAYAAWMIGPYLQSAIIRDAAVTTWLRAAVSPIDGRIVTELPLVGSLVGENGHIATIRNDLLLQERRAVENTRDKIINSRSKIKEADEYLADLKLIDQERIDAKKKHAQMFHAQLETDIANLRQKITVNDERIKVVQRIAERQKLLTDRGTGSQAAYDETLLRVAQMNARSTELNSTLNLLLLRDRSAETGVYIDNEGAMPNWLRYGELQLRLEIRRASHEKHAAEAALSEATKDIENEQQTLNALSQAEVTAPPGSFIHSVRAAPGATVSAGDKIVEWIDCQELLIDVPVSDAELPLILRGMRAEVILEGENFSREATVYRSRGSSATLGSSDLSAISKGRTAGVAQVLLTLDLPPDNSKDCLVGRAAYVEFPDVGIIDVVRARLRL